MLHFSTVPGEGEVRLVGGSDPHEGRVEVYHNDAWGAICSSEWDLQDATVVCRQLGHSAVVDVPQNEFAVSGGPVWYDSMNCSGVETNLSQCTHKGFGVHNCISSNNAEVICTSEYISAYCS